MDELTDYERRSIQKFGEAAMNDQWSTAGMLQLIAAAGDFLNLQTIPLYQKRTGISYNGAKNHRHTVKLFGATLVADPD